MNFASPTPYDLHRRSWRRDGIEIVWGVGLQRGRAIRAVHCGISAIIAQPGSGQLSARLSRYPASREGPLTEPTDGVSRRAAARIDDECGYPFSDNSGLRSATSMIEEGAIRWFILL